MWSKLPTIMNLRAQARVGHALAGREAGFRGPAKEGGGEPERVTHGLARQPGLVLPVPSQLPLLPAGRERVETRLGQRPPGPRRDGAAPRLDEVGVVQVVAHLVTHEPQAAERSLDRLPLRRLVTGQHAVVG